MSSLDFKIEELDLALRVYKNSLERERVKASSKILEQFVHLKRVIEEGKHLGSYAASPSIFPPLRRLAASYNGRHNSLTPLTKDEALKLIEEWEATAKNYLRKGGFYLKTEIENFDKWSNRIRKEQRVNLFNRKQ